MLYCSAPRRRLGARVQCHYVTTFTATQKLKNFRATQYLSLAFRTIEFAFVFVFADLMLFLAFEMSSSDSSPSPLDFLFFSALPQRRIFFLTFCSMNSDESLSGFQMYIDLIRKACQLKWTRCHPDNGYSLTNKPMCKIAIPWAARCQNIILRMQLVHRAYSHDVGVHDRSNQLPRAGVNIINRMQCSKSSVIFTYVTSNNCNRLRRVLQHKHHLTF